MVQYCLSGFALAGAGEKPYGVIADEDPAYVGAKGSTLLTDKGKRRCR